MKRFSRHIMNSINLALPVWNEQDYTPKSAGLSKSNFSLM